VPVTIRKFKHFVVFRGLVNDHVVVADPAFGNTTMPRKQFLKIWNGMALVVTRSGPTRFQSMLHIVSDDALIAETPSTRRFVETAVGFHGRVSHNEF
jgi:predicted double-glycine peptidase